MLPKRSTHVDQNLGYESIDSKLSVAIFTVPRNLLVTLNDVIYQKNFQKLRNPWGPTPLVSFWRDIVSKIAYKSLQNTKIVHFPAPPKLLMVHVF